jgi:hypothetical protein
MLETIKRDWLNYLLLTLILGFVFYMKFWHHELWKDEWQAWFVSKDKSLSEVFSFLYYEGHPALWYIYLKIFTLFPDTISEVLLIQVSHLFTVGMGLYFLMIKFRLSTFLKVLFALSYFVLFEYGLINRGYFLVILFLFWSVYLIGKKDYSKTGLAVCLFLLCQTEVYGVLMAIALGFYILYEDQFKLSTFSKKEFIGLLSGMTVFIISVFPRSTGHVAKTSSKDLSILDNLLTTFQGNLSNTYLIGSTDDTFTYGWTGIGLVMSIFCLAAIIYIFKTHKSLLYTFLLFLGMMMTFSMVIFLGGIRQWGMGFVFFIALLELRQVSVSKEKLVVLFLSIIGLLNLIHGAKAIVEEINIPFTNAKEAGLFIKEKVPLNVPIVAINKFEATPVLGYAGRKFYELPEGLAFSYFRWVDKIYLPVENELRMFGKFKGVGGIIVLSPKPLDKDRFPSLQLWKQFNSTNYKKENYYLYSMPLSTPKAE